jgi:hypothetical protein
MDIVKLRNKMTNSVWVLTREINQYDQDGEYFVAVFKTKPTAKQLAHTLTSYNHLSSNVMAALATVLHILDGGGREGTEDEWYNLREESFID